MAGWTRGVRMSLPSLVSCRTSSFAADVGVLFSALWFAGMFVYVNSAPSGFPNYGFAI